MSAMDAGKFLGACAANDLNQIMALLADVQFGVGRDVLTQGLAVAQLSGAAEVAEFIRPIIEALSVTENAPSSLGADELAADESRQSPLPGTSSSSHEDAFVEACAEGDIDVVTDYIVRMARGEFDASDSVIQRALDAADQHGHGGAVQQVMEDVEQIGSLYKAMPDGASDSDADDVYSMARSGEALCRKLGPALDFALQMFLGAIGEVLALRGDFGGAIKAHSEEIETCVSLGDLASAQVAMGTCASVHLAMYAESSDPAHLAELMTLAERQELIARDLGLEAGIAESAYFQVLAVAAGHTPTTDLAGYIRKARESIRFYESAGVTTRAAQLRAALVGLLAASGDSESALEQVLLLMERQADQEGARVEVEGLDGKPESADSRHTPASMQSAPVSASELERQLKILAARDEGLHGGAVEVLRSAGAAARLTLEGGLTARSRTVRRVCAALIGELADGASVAPLAARLEDPDDEALVRVALALGTIGTPEALEALRRAAQVADPRVSTMASGGLYLAAEPGVREELVRRIRQGDANERWAAAWTLGFCGSTAQDVALLEEVAANDRGSVVRQTAATAAQGVQQRLGIGAVAGTRGAEGRGSADASALRATLQAMRVSSAEIRDDNSSTAEDLLAELIEAPSPGLVMRLAARGAEAVEAVIESDDVQPFSGDEAYRWVSWAIGRVDDVEATDLLLECGLTVFEEASMAVQCLRAIVRANSSGSPEIAEMIAPEGSLEDDPNWREVVLAGMFSAALVAGDTRSSGALASALRDNLDIAMLWEQRIHVEREYGLLGDHLDPLYAAFEEALRTFKGPYYFRTAEERKRRLEQRGQDTAGMFPSEGDLAQVGPGSQVKLVLEHEHEVGYHVAEVHVTVAERSRDSRGETVLRGRVDRCDLWAGPYAVEEGEEVLFIPAHIHQVL